MNKKILYAAILAISILWSGGCAGTKQADEGHPDAPEITITESGPPALESTAAPSEALVPESTRNPESSEVPKEPEDPFLYQTEQQIPLADGQKLTLLLYSKEFESGYGVSRIDVKKGETLIQSILLSEAMSENGDPDAGWESGYTRCDNRNGGLMLEDMNFDGYTDLGLTVSTIGEKPLCYFWIWDDINAQFSFGFRLEDPVADAERRQIVCHHPDEAENNIADYYQFEDSGTLVWTNREITSLCDDGTEHTEYYLVQDGELSPDFRIKPLDQNMYTQKKTGIYSGNSKDYQKLDSLRQNTEIKVIGQCENGWYQILYQDNTAYVAGDCLGENPVEQPVPAPSPAPEPTPQPEPAPQPAPAPASSAYYLDDYAKNVLTIVNEKRAEAGLGALTMNDTLVSAAKTRAVEITQSFSHNRPDGSSCFTVFNVSYTTAGENLAAGQPSPEQAMDSWMNSEGHRVNILAPDFTQIAIACYYVPGSTYEYYWVQLFIG